MEYLTGLIDAVQARPLLGVVLVAGLVLGYALLQRRSRLQRDADRHLSVLRRDKSDQYTKLRPPR